MVDRQFGELEAAGSNPVSLTSIRMWANLVSHLVWGEGIMQVRFLSS